MDAGVSIGWSASVTKTGVKLIEERPPHFSSEPNPGNLLHIAVPDGKGGVDVFTLSITAYEGNHASVPKAITHLRDRYLTADPPISTQ